MKDLLKSKGFSLVEVLASIVLIFILFTLVGNYFVKSHEQSNYLDREYTCTQLCEALLKVYRAESYSNLVKHVGQTIEINDIAEELQLDSTVDITHYNASIKIDNHPNNKLANRAVIIEVSVCQQGKQPVTMEGIVRK